MNTSGAIAELFKLARELPAIVSAGSASAAAAFMHQALELLGISPLERTPVERRDPVARLGADFLDRLHARTGDVVHVNGGGAQAGIEAVIAARNAARAAKDFALADRLRVALADLGVALEDSKGGTTWSVAG